MPRPLTPNAKTAFLTMAETHVATLRDIRAHLERQLAEVSLTIQRQEDLIASLKRSEPTC